LTAERTVDLDTITDYRPAPGLRRLLGLRGFGWASLTESRGGLEIAATCTIGELARWRPTGPDADAAAWAAVPLLRQCCEALLASFKVQNMATVGGNICLALPAGAMTSLAAALDGVANLWSPGGGVGARAPAD
jgi:CO/xanthine dehydrogenase FAD-binding subunit